MIDFDDDVNEIVIEHMEARRDDEEKSTNIDKNIFAFDRDITERDEYRAVSRNVHEKRRLARDERRTAWNLKEWPWKRKKGTENKRSVKEC